MPNWCECDLTIEGPQTEVERFLEFAKGENGDVDFNRFIPYPDRFAELDIAAKRWLEAYKENKAAKWYDCPKDGFNSGGYEWCRDNWGTKWNACRVRTGAVESCECSAWAMLSFETAWSPPAPVVKKASELFPDLCLTLCYFERGMEFNGIYRCKGGDVLRDESGPYFGNRGG